MKRPKHKEAPEQPKVKIRPDLQDASKGKDLSYLNEMPQMGRDEGVKAGIPPPEEPTVKSKRND